MSYYRHHVFFCTNRRPAGARVSCGTKNAEQARDHAKQRIKELQLSAPGAVRINNAGCMERCEEGPCIAIYPQAVWYSYQNERDIDEIVDRHIMGGEIVERLRLKDRP